MKTSLCAQRETPLSGAYNVRIVEQIECAPHHFRLTLHCPEIARTARAGQFVHVLPRSGQFYDPLLRRAFSVMSTQNDDFQILYRVMGRGTDAMSQWRSGETVSVLGPLGQPFSGLRQYSLLVGGGVGVPPLAMLASQRRNETVTALLGARSTHDIICREEFARYGIAAETATDDGSEGQPGFVTNLLSQHLAEWQEQEKVSLTSRDISDLGVFACGPLPMLRAVARLCAEYKVGCQVSLEEAMPCGVGVCNGCVVPVVTANDDYGGYRRVCVDGPVMAACEVKWDELPHV